MQRLAIFDVDGTLYEGTLWRSIVRFHRDRGTRRPFLWGFFATHLPLWILARLKLVDEGWFRARWMEDLAGIFRGMERDELGELIEALLDGHVVSRLRREVVGRLEAHRRAGELVILLSGAFQPIVERLGDRLGVEHVIGTQLQFSDGACTGRIVRPFCEGREKVRRLRTLLSQIQASADMPQSYAYADSPFDLPVLELVGNPVIVGSDPRMLAVAHDRSWPVVEAGGEA